MQKILVIGASGMAGHVVTTHLIECGYQVNTLAGTNKYNEGTTLLDLTDMPALETFLNANTFDVIVNCAGMLVKASEVRKDLAVHINSYIPHYLENKYHGTSTKIIHLSTDCVFSGKNAPYTEMSLPDGELFYDRSKFLGEIINEKDLTFRMSIIGPDMQEAGVGLFNWFYAQKGEISGYTGSTWNGVTTIQLARAIAAAIDTNLTGLYHLVPQSNITKYNLLLLFREVFNRSDIIVNPTEGVSHDKTLVNTRTDFSYSLPDYPEMIKEMKQWIVQHKSLYSHYEVVD